MRPGKAIRKSTNNLSPPTHLSDLKLGNLDRKDKLIGSDASKRKIGMKGIRNGQDSFILSWRLAAESPCFAEVEKTKLCALRTRGARQ